MEEIIQVIVQVMRAQRETSASCSYIPSCVQQPPKVVLNSLPQTPTAAIQPTVVIPATSPALDTYALLQKVITLLTVQQ